MQETVSQVVAQAKQAKIDRLQDAEAEYAELLAKIVAGDDVAQSAASACGLLEELGRDIGDLERDVRVYSERQSAIESLQQMPELTAARERAHENLVAVKAKAEEDLRRIQAGIIEADNEYNAARIREVDASYAANALERSLPSWMATQHQRVRQLSGVASEDESPRLNQSELPQRRRDWLLDLARKPIAWPLPRDAEQSAV
jgi:hypothetical protein